MAGLEMPKSKQRHAVTFATLTLLIAAIATLYYFKDRTAPTDLGAVSNVPEYLLEARSNILRTMKKTGVPAISVAVAKDGEVIWAEGFGWADKKQKIRATPDTIYRTASLSKAITATGLMVLVERGLVDLESPANDYLGQSKLVAHAGNAEDATVSRLVFHTSGLPMYWNFFPEADTARRPNIDESIGKYGILVTPPGAQYRYSNLGYGIIDHIISQASGRPYRDFMREEVFEPLGMTHTSVLVNPDLESLTATMYNAEKKPIPSYDFDHRGASAVVSSVHDLVRFGMFHLKHRLSDQDSILSEKMIDRMHSETGSSFDDQGGIVVDYLLGSFGGIDYGGHRFEVASGAMPGATSRLALVPSENLITVVLCNSDNITLWDIEAVILEAMLPGFSKDDVANEASPESQTQEEPPDGFVGSWSGEILTHTDSLPLTIDFFESGRTRVTIRGTPLSPLRMRTPMGDTGFVDHTFRSLYRGHLPTPDAARSSHVLMLEVELRDDRLSGYIAAIAINHDFCLPYWIELTRQDR
jgi:CubicO group peptidase (beta-lactamase class C family)